MGSSTGAFAPGYHIGWGLGIAVSLLVGGQALAVVTGLASGDTEPTGWQWALVLASIGTYSLALVVIGVGGVLLVRDLFKPASLVDLGHHN